LGVATTAAPRAAPKFARSASKVQMLRISFCSAARFFIRMRIPCASANASALRWPGAMRAL
jgi:hypothetical protein